MQHVWNLKKQMVSDANYNMYFRGQKISKAVYKGKVIWGANEFPEIQDLRNWSLGYSNVFYYISYDANTTKNVLYIGLKNLTYEKFYIRCEVIPEKQYVFSFQIMAPHGYEIHSTYGDYRYGYVLEEVPKDDRQDSYIARTSRFAANLTSYHSYSVTFTAPSQGYVYLAIDLTGVKDNTDAVFNIKNIQLISL